MYYIYGLVDPTTHLVRYVGLTTQSPESRHRQHCNGSNPSTETWIRSLASPPGLVVLERGQERRVKIGSQGVHVVRDVTVCASRVAETKWIKRFRRTALNLQLRENCKAVWDGLTNASERE